MSQRGPSSCACVCVCHVARDARAAWRNYSAVVATMGVQFNLVVPYGIPAPPRALPYTTRDAISRR